MALLPILLMGCTCSVEPPLQLDHIVLATNNLDEGIKEFQNSTGLRPTYGGRHANSYTHSATVALKGNMYVEILAPKDNLDSIPAFFQKIHGLTPIGFAVSVNDVSRFKRRIETLGFQTNGINNWLRKKTEPEEFQCNFIMTNDPQLTMNPLFVNWSESAEPSSLESDGSSYLKSLELATPYKEEVEQLFVSNRTLFQQLKFSKRQQAKIRFALQTPKGLIKFGE